MESHEVTPLTLGLTTRLSPELHDRIIDHLHSYKRSLSACSIVCQSWFPASRYHLFHNVNLSPNLVSFLFSSPHAMETITPYIHDAALGGAWVSEQQSVFDVVISLLLKLERCHGLYLETWSWDFLSKSSRDLLLMSEGVFFRNITSIHLKYIRFPSFPLLVEFLGGFPALEVLSFDNVTWDSDEDRSSPQPSGQAQVCFSRPLRLTNLYVRSCLVEPILSWLFPNHPSYDDFDGRESSRTLVTALSLPEILPEELKVVGRVLRALGTSLRHLELGFLSLTLDNSDNISLPGLVDLSYNTNLRQIYVHQLTLYHFALGSSPSSSPGSSALLTHSRSYSPYYWLVPMLSGILSSHLQELVLIVWLSAESQLELIDWVAMNKLLLSPPFSSLQRVRFEVMGMGRDRDLLRSWLSMRLDRWTVADADLTVKFIDGY